MTDTVTILSHDQILHKTKRIAFQIYETFIDQEQIIIAGIKNKGSVFAKMVMDELLQISELKVQLCQLSLEKDHSGIYQIKSTLEKESFKDKGVVVIDDVLHTGATLIYAVNYFLSVPTYKIKTAVLVDRNHKQYPIKVDFKGLSLSTSLNEHVEVCFNTGRNYVILT